MKVIKTNPSKTVTLKELYVGSVYVFDDTAYMKISEESKRNTENPDETEVEVVNLETGYYKSVKDSIKVSTIKATLNI